MNLSDIKKSLAKFFRGEETKKGRDLIGKWYHHFDQSDNKLSDALNGKEKEELRKELLSRIRTKAGYLKSPRKSGGRSHWSSGATGIIKIAAGFIIMLLISLPIVFYAGILELDSPNVNSVKYRTASNPVGQTSQITLADGSTVWLSAGSTLWYPENFKESFREVDLKGEAFFEIARNPDKPFIVNSEHLRTRVLGTSFNIRAFEDEKDIQVTVATGRVSVRQKVALTDNFEESIDPVAVLKPEQQLVFNKQNQTGITQTVNSTLYTSWKDGKLIFENHSFEEIARRLARWYGVRIHFTDDTLKHERFKIAFENNSLQHALQMLQVIKAFEFDIKDSHVRIKPSS